MAIVLIDKGMFRICPELVKKAIEKIKPTHMTSVNDNIKRYHFESDKYASNEIVLAKIDENNNLKLCY